MYINTETNFPSSAVVSTVKDEWINPFGDVSLLFMYVGQVLFSWVMEKTYCITLVWFTHCSKPKSRKPDDGLAGCMVPATVCTS